jgi:hypothetical protein
MSVSGLEHREGLLSVGFSTHLTEKFRGCRRTEAFTQRAQNPDLSLDNRWEWDHPWR